LAEANQKIETLAKEQAKASRVSLLVDAGLDREKALEVFSKFESVDDTAFAAIVEIQKEALAAKYMDKDKKEEEDKKKKMEAEKAKAEAEAEAARVALEKAKAEEDASLGTGSNDKNLEAAVAAVQKYFKDSMKQAK
jgi:hypothetical protein